MSWRKELNADPLPWLLEAEDPGVRYLALRDLLDVAPHHAELLEARQQAYAVGPIATVLKEMDSQGYWVRPGAGYNPKYRSAVWSLVLLAQLGASAQEDARIAKACAYYLEHSMTEQGIFTGTGAKSGTADCLQGNMCTAMLELEYEDPRLDKAFEWMARSLTGEGVAPLSDKQAELRYYAGKCGPVFACGANNKQPCAWGAAKVMLAFSKLPHEKYTPIIERAIQRGVDFLFSNDPAKADYPCGWTPKPSRNWWKFGFPVFYITDILQIVDALVGLGYGKDARLADALALIRSKQDACGRWLMEFDYTGKTWVDFGPKKQPNKWVTSRVLKVLKAASA